MASARGKDNRRYSRTRSLGGVPGWISLPSGGRPVPKQSISYAIAPINPFVAPYGTVRSGLVSCQRNRGSYVRPPEGQITMDDGELTARIWLAVLILGAIIGLYKGLRGKD